MSVSGEQKFSTEIAASVDQCFATITDFERYPDWFSSIERSRVLEHYPDGLAKRVEFHIDMKLKTIRYVLEYCYDKPTHLTWKAVDGDIDAVAGDYRFEKLGARESRHLPAIRIAGILGAGPYPQADRATSLAAISARVQSRRRVRHEEARACARQEGLSPRMADR